MAKCGALSMFLKDVGWPSMVGCFVAFLCATVILQSAQGRRLTARTVAYCVTLSLYCTFVVMRMSRTFFLIGTAVGILDQK